ncbi:antibiotic biosynthesis monooxygenase [Olleya sp. YS]|uniref:putative quinol monooxygenase n=1 Tax=Olleya sp. YS TaxID=3028318 RepID=UPI0024343302|nr:antibiotic biosynthesis monooxygenase [Olleya sp. YS]WGD34287.1 antibiotic biosynthesis monooxygenase [Olleya sp. YS]
MLVRIVKLSFEDAHIDTFLANFETVKHKIRGFEGNQLLELYRDKHNSNVFFTYSYWNDESDLENYRNSDLFKSIWAKTKPLFNAKPEAWSVDKMVSLQ